MTIRYTNLMGIVAAAAFLLTATAQAQQGQPGQPQQPGSQGMERQGPPPQQPSMDVSDKKLDQFAEAYEEVRDIQQSFRGDMQQAQDSQEASKIQSEAEEQAVAAIRDAGLEPSEYNQISQAVQNDPSLQEKLDKRLNR